MNYISTDKFTSVSSPEVLRLASQLKSSSFNTAVGTTSSSSSSNTPSPIKRKPATPRFSPQSHTSTSPSSSSSPAGAGALGPGDLDLSQCSRLTVIEMEQPEEVMKLAFILFAIPIKLA